jgi:hemolysin activation/secretion protein
MAYSNFEMRKLLRSFKYLWFQPVVFYDVGMAGSSWDVAQDQQRAAVGAGIRFDVPQVYRLMFRIDYAWATDGSGQQGITAGMNQFFQPYRPL